MGIVLYEGDIVISGDVGYEVGSDYTFKNVAEFLKSTVVINRLIYNFDFVASLDKNQYEILNDDVMIVYREE